MTEHKPIVVAKNNREEIRVAVVEDGLIDLRIYQRNYTGEHVSTGRGFRVRAASVAALVEALHEAADRIGGEK